MQKNIGNLCKSSLEFSDYLSSDYGKELLHKNKLKIHLESGKIFHDNVNTGENFATLLMIKKMKPKNLKFKNLNLNMSSDFEYYVRETLSRTTNVGLNFVKMRQQNFYFIDLIISSIFY